MGGCAASDLVTRASSLSALKDAVGPRGVHAYFDVQRNIEEAVSWLMSYRSDPLVMTA
jgi:hypothetical protein